MIDLNLKRDENGRLRLEDASIEGVNLLAQDIVTDIFDDRPRSRHWFKDETGKRVLAKFRNEEFVPLYLSDIFAEIIFETFAKANKIPCTNVDVGEVSRRTIFLSEYASKNNNPIITYRNIFDFLHNGFGMAIGEDYSIDGVMENVQNFATQNGFSVSKNLRNDILKMMLVDFLTFQLDRHDENILFETNGSEIRLTPYIDNEKAFLIDRIAVFLQSLDFFDLKVYKKSLQPSGKDDPEVKKCFESVEKSTKIFSTPILVPKIHYYNELEFEGLFDEEPIDEFNEHGSNNALMTAYADDFASEMAKNEELREFYENLKFNLREMMEKRAEKNSFYIPQFYIDFAETILQKQRRRIERAMEKIERRENGK